MHRITYRFSRAHAVLCLIVLVYTVLSFWNLGDALAPVTQPDLGEGEGRGCLSYAAVPEPTALDSLILYKGLGTCGVTVYIPDESGDNWVEVSRQVCDAIYAWEEIPLACNAASTGPTKPLFTIPLSVTIRTELILSFWATFPISVHALMISGSL